MAWRWSVCGTAEVVWKPRFLWQWPSGHLHCWVWCLSSSSWHYLHCWVWCLSSSSWQEVQVRRVCWPIKHSNTMVIEPAFGTFGSVDRCQVLLENEISIFKKLVSRRKHEVLQNFLVNGCSDVGFQKTQWTNTTRWHCTPNHHRLWKLHTGLQATWIMCLSSLPPDSGTLFPN